MGRWAQAHRRGGYTSPPSGFPLEPPTGGEWSARFDDPADPGQAELDTSFPVGADGIAWNNGTNIDPFLDSGVHTGGASFGLTNFSGNGPDNRFQYAWTLSGEQVSEYGPIIPWESI